MAQQYQDILQRSQWQRAQLEQGARASGGSTRPSWSVSCSSTQRPPGAWAMMAAGRPQRRHSTGGTWWRVSCSGSAGEGPTRRAPRRAGSSPKALALGGADKATAEDQTSRQSADSRLQMDTTPLGPLNQATASLAGDSGIETPASLCPCPGLAGWALDSPVCTAWGVGPLVCPGGGGS